MITPTEERVALSGWCNGHPQSRPQHEHCRSEICGCPCHQRGDRDG